MNLDFKQTELRQVSDIVVPDIFYRRMMTGINTIDNDLLHEGFLPGSTMTITAAAGCGKTTFMVQLLDGLAKNGYKVGYCSGEENVYQLTFTCNRIRCNTLSIANVSDIDELAKLTKQLDFLVIDSFQALTTKTKMNSMAKERYAVQTLVKAAQKNECCVAFVMHLTKAGKLKGSTVVPHTVDANLNIAPNPDVDDEARSIWFSKNRFGPTNSIDLFMTAKGFDMSAKIIVDNEKKFSGKANKKNQIKKDIIKSDKKVSVNELVEKYNISEVYANTALRELTKEGKVLKIGRGSDARWLTKEIVKKKAQVALKVA